MGFKRPFDEEAFQESPFKLTRQDDRGLKLISYADIFPFSQAPKKIDIPVEGEERFYKFEICDERENVSANLVSDIADAEFKMSDPFPWITSSTRLENAGSGAAVCSGLPPEYFDSNSSKRSLVHCRDVYSSLLDVSPRIQVPLGPNHQVEVPVWDLQVSDHIVDDDYGKNLMGARVIPFPDLESHAHGGLKVGYGRTDCTCLDAGSVRCIRLHVMEARERIRENLGHENFMELGFDDMGEVVSQKWTEDEEQVFHEVIYSNPLSLGWNFWKLLSAMFPSRTKQELVSYYFNVFMLRKRAAQNRSSVMDIDSDDDEWQGIDGRLFGVPEEYENSAIESFVPQDGRSDEEDDYLDDDDPDDSGDGDNETGNYVSDRIGDPNVRDDGEEMTEKDCVRSHVSKAQSCRTLDDCSFEFAVHHMKDDFDLQPFEYQPSTDNSRCPLDNRGAIQEEGISSNYTKFFCEIGD